MVTKDQHIQLIVSANRVEMPGYRSIYFHRPAHFMFEPGDWMDLYLEDRELRGGATYSLSSSPTEPELRITFREGVSERKRALQSASEGDAWYISQYGNDYGFQLKNHQSSVLIAGGVGSAPFRSMLKQLYDTQGTDDVQLLYLNQTEDFLFKDELDTWSRELPNLSIVYITTSEINRKKREKLILSLIKNRNQNFYISGPPGMVEANEHLLIDNGVPVRNIRIDSFGGY